MNEPTQATGTKKPARRRREAAPKRKMQPREPRLRSDKLPKSTVGQWFEGEPLRESVLLFYPKALRSLLGPCLSQLTSEFLELGGYDPTYRGSLAKGFLRAAALDLRYTARMLALTAREAASNSDTSEPEKQLGMFADELAVGVEALANRIVERIEGKRRAARSHV